MNMPITPGEARAKRQKPHENALKLEIEKINAYVSSRSPNAVDESWWCDVTGVANEVRDALVETYTMAGWKAQIVYDRDGTSLVLKETR